MARRKKVTAGQAVIRSIAAETPGSAGIKRRIGLN
jgi:hypothetical protein